MARAVNMDAYLEQLAAVIAEYGHAVQYVGATAEKPSWSYTIGLSKWEHPEVLTYALPPQVGKALLNDVADKVKAGEPMLHGTERRDIVRGLPVMFLDVADTSISEFNMARALLPRVHAVQMVWTDKAGRYPWDPGYDVSPELQPLLGSHP